MSAIHEESIPRGGEVGGGGARKFGVRKGETINLAKDLCQQIRAHVRCWKLRSRNDVQTEGRPRPPPGNTVITIITYRALILISPSYVSLSIFFDLPPRFHGDSSFVALTARKRNFFFARVDRPRFIIGTLRVSSLTSGLSKPNSVLFLSRDRFLINIHLSFLENLP